MDSELLHMISFLKLPLKKLLQLLIVFRCALYLASKLPPHSARPRLRGRARKGVVILILNYSIAPLQTHDVVLVCTVVVELVQNFVEFDRTLLVDVVIVVRAVLRD